jgi:hypothetical protein
MFVGTLLYVMNGMETLNGRETQTILTFELNTLVNS